MGAVAPMLSVGASTAQGLRRGSHRRVAYCGSRAMQNSLLADVLQRAAQWRMTSTPGKTQRLSVPVTPEVHAIFQRLAEASGHSMAAALGQWLNDTKDAAGLMAENLERLRGAPGDLMMKVRLHTGSVEDIAEMAIEDAIRRAEDLETLNERAAEQTRARPGGDPLAGRVRASAAAAQPSSQPLTPPSSNTGGKVHKRGQKGG